MQETLTVCDGVRVILYTLCLYYVSSVSRISRMPTSTNSRKRKAANDGPTKTKKRKVESEPDSDPFVDKAEQEHNDWIAKLEKLNPGANFPEAH